jgi:NOL1/NOP2/sun family putative RNA methylase
MLPSIFLERLERIIPSENVSAVIDTFAQKRDAAIRLNRLKADTPEVTGFLREHNISSRMFPWYDQAFLLEGMASTQVSSWDLTAQGKIFIQSLSSMLPVVVLDPQPGETVLDLCAAPGGKTTQMAAHMRNNGKIVAVEAVRERLYRLKSVVGILDAKIVETKCLDGRRFRPGGLLFDRILVDAPCSSEGRFKTYDKKTVGYWSLRKIREMVKKQRGLLWNACRILKPGGVLVYSTCTFAPEENEGVLSWVLRKMEGEVTLEPVDLPGVECYPAITAWGEKTFDPSVARSCRVLPTSTMEGFFLAKIIKRI